LNEAKELCKTFLKSIGDSKARNGGELSVDRYNKELIRFDETFFNKVREKKQKDSITCYCFCSQMCHLYSSSTRNL
jgi:hypothetical protein